MEKNTDWVLKSISDMVPWALDHAEYVTIGAQDASRADAWFLEAFLNALIQYKITRVRIADTVGILNPFSTYDLFRLLHQKFPDTCFEFHGHNDLGMATANALAACKGGATFIDTTVNGLGERAGNTSMEEFVMAMKLSMDVNLTIEPYCFAALSKYVSKV
jgi:homocitrate synthase NifV